MFQISYPSENVGVHVPRSRQGSKHGLVVRIKKEVVVKVVAVRIIAHQHKHIVGTLLGQKCAVETDLDMDV